MAEETKKPRKNKKDEEIKELTLKLEEEHNLLLRTAAEFDNYKKRTDREKLTVGEYAKADVIKKILPVLDNIERAAGLDTTSADYIKGIELIVKQLLSLAENIGIVPLAAVGEEFNPSYHDAVMHIDDENLGENVIAEVLQQGYKIGETVIRPAMVKVAN
ncbi:MAG: nucleotide exchange factor GrpE [Clostridia bacterium]|nr:nucleotide exchange factor GrpE [Oscillospiraceae bacterium]MBQ2746306.1 nucleotide exchange factor GrpE [Clostridia bacterium]